MKKYHSKKIAKQFDSSKFLKTIGRQLKEIRSVQNKSITYVAKKAGISNSRLEKIEEGSINYNLWLLYKICDIYDINIIDLFPQAKG